MGRTGVGFLKSSFSGTYTTNYTTNLVYASITFTGGPLGTNGNYFDVPPTGAYTVALSPGGVGTLNSGGGVYVTAGNPALSGAYPVYWYDDAFPSGVVNPYSWETFEALDPMIWGAYNYMVAMTNVIVTNTTPVYITQTNTIGFFPSAPHRFAYGIRAAFWNDQKNPWPTPYNLQGEPDINWRPALVPLMDPFFPIPAAWAGHTGWIIPDDEYMISGGATWFGSHPMTNVFTAPMHWYTDFSDPLTWSQFVDEYQSRARYVWTNYVTLPVAVTISTTNYDTSTIRTNGTTNILHSSTNYTASRFLDTFFSMNDVSPAEYGTEEPAGMFFAFEKNGPIIRRLDWSDGGTGYISSPPSPLQPMPWSTNVYRDMGRALSLLQWIREYRTDCELVTWTAQYTNGVFDSLTVATNFSTGVAGVSASSGTPRRITISGTVAKYAITNARPFTIDNVYFVPDAISFTNGITAGTWGSNPPPISAVAPNESATADWWPISPDEMRTWVDDTAAGIEYGVDPLPSLSVSMPCVAFHVQFSALTNYLDHAPAR
jgi:hypothetical protein